MRLKHKFGAKRTSIGEKSFASKLEAKCYQALQSLKEGGHILFFLREVPVELPGKSKHRIDYLVFTPEDAFFIECKAEGKAGRAPVGELKRKQAQEILGVDIHLAHKPEDIYAILR